MKHSSARVCIVLLGAIAVAACTSVGEDKTASTGQQATVREEQYASCKTYTKLSETGLYEMDAATRTDVIAAGVTEYKPAYPLWSDGLGKKRWFRLPAGGQVDTTDMDHWRFPKGTIFWKEFRAPGEGGRRIETRVIEMGCGTKGDFFVGAFIWDDAEADATFAPRGGTAPVAGPRRFTHTIPKQDSCFDCHQGEGRKPSGGAESEPTLMLGFSAIQLGEPGLPVSVASLRDAQLLSAPPQGEATFVLPGTPVEKAALGYMHGNCGHCHNPEGIATGMTDQLLRFDVADTTLATMQATSVFRSIVGVKNSMFDGKPLRVDPAQFAESAILVRMKSRKEDVLMPPLGTVLPDDAGGVAKLEAWGKTLGAAGIPAVPVEAESE